MKYINYKIIIVILLSILITPYINNFILYYFTSDVNIKIYKSTLSNENEVNAVWGYGFGSYIYNNVNADLCKVNMCNNTEYLTPPPHNREYIKLNKDGFMSVNIKNSPFSWIGIYKGVDAGKFDIYIEDKLYKTIDAKTTYAQSPETRTYLFANSNSVVLLWFLKLSIFYVFTATFIYFLLLLFEKILKISSSYNIKEKLLQPHNSLFSFIIWFLFSFILFSVWMNFDTTWLKVGDAKWYAFLYETWNGNHIFDINNYAINQTFTPRAYITGIIPYIAYLISFQSIPLYYYIYFIFAAFFISLFMNIIIPKIYELLSGKKPAFIQTQVFALIFFFYWWNYIYDFIVDVYAVLFLSLAFMSYLLFKQKQKMSYIVLAGICLSLSILYRNSYVIFLYLLCFIFIIQLFRVKFISIFHKNYLFILFFIIGIIIPCIPQIYISYIHDGIFSLYGYDKVGVYTSPTQTLSSELTSWSLYNITGWPWVLPNGIMLSHLNDIIPFSDAKEMNIAMVLLTYFSNMFSALFVLINKFLYFIFPTQIIVYREQTYNILLHSLIFYIPRILNILLISLFLLACLNRNFRERFIFNKNYIIYYFFIFMFIAINLLFHVEVRYILPVYVLFYYIISYHIIAKFFNSSNKLNIIRNNIKPYTAIVFLMTYIFFNLFT